MEAKEIWKDIPLYEGYYQASSCGRIRSINRIIECQSTNQYGIYYTKRKLKSKILAQTIDKAGYHNIILSKGGIVKTYLVARLILLTFIGDQPMGKECCHFPDFNKSNNRVDNLIWGTPKENINHKKLGGNSTMGTGNGRAKLNENQIQEIFALSKNKTNIEIAKIYNITSSNICAILKRRLWKHIKI